MNISIIFLFADSVRFNEYGVAQNGLSYKISFKKFYVIFRLCFCNGKWAGSYDIGTPMWGSASPIIKMDFKYSTFKGCVDSLWKTVYQILSNHKNSPELSWFEKQYEKWNALSVEQKYNLFNKSNFYGSWI